MRRFSSGRVVRLFDLQLEQNIRSKIDSLPKLDNIFTNADGSRRKPSDAELETLAQLNYLSTQRTLSWMNNFNLTEEQENLYNDNLEDLSNLNVSTKKIVDKIPFSDPVTNEIKWKIVREDEREGWERVTYYLYIPLLIGLVGILILKQDDDIMTWADDELMLRLRETHPDDQELIEALDNLIPELEVKLTRQQIDLRDAVIIERILSGDYDRLMSLKVRQNETA